MKRWERWSFNGLTLLVAVTGFAYLWMKYGLRTDDPFALVNHPWQTSMLALHVVSAPALLLMFGVILNSHIAKKLNVRRTSNRRSGLVALGTFAVMSVTGYLLQVSTDETWLRVLVVAHIATGALFSITYAAHLVIGLGITRTRDVTPAHRRTPTRRGHRRRTRVGAGRVAGEIA